MYRVATWFVPAARGRIVKLANLGIHPSSSDTKRFTKFLTETSQADWLILFYLAQFMHIKVFHVQGHQHTGTDFLTHINTRSPVVKAVKLMACRQAKSSLKIPS